MTALDRDAGRASRPVGALVGRVAVWLVFALLFAYMTVQAAGNLVAVAHRVDEFNAFIGDDPAAGSLRRSVPWLWLVLDIAVAPVAFVVALWVTRRATVLVTLAVFVVAFAAAGALWLDLQLFVPRLLDF